MIPFEGASHNVTIKEDCFYVGHVVPPEHQMKYSTGPWPDTSPKLEESTNEYDDNTPDRTDR